MWNKNSLTLYKLPKGHLWKWWTENLLKLCSVVIWFWITLCLEVRCLTCAYTCQRALNSFRSTHRLQTAEVSRERKSVIFLGDTGPVQLAVNQTSSRIADNFYLCCFSPIINTLIKWKLTTWVVFVKRHSANIVSNKRLFVAIQFLLGITEIWEADVLPTAKGSSWN